MTKEKLFKVERKGTNLRWDNIFKIETTLFEGEPMYKLYSTEGLVGAVPKKLAKVKRR